MFPTDGLFDWGSSSIWRFICKPSRLFRAWFWRLLFDILRFSYFAEDILSAEAPCARPGKASNSKDSLEDVQNHSSIKGRLESIGDYINQQRYSNHFLRLFLLPMVAAPWCTNPDEFSRNFPAEALIRFMKVYLGRAFNPYLLIISRSQHGLLTTLTRTLRWHSFRNGSKTYVDAFRQQLSPRHRLHLNTSIRRVSRRRTGKVSIEFDNGSSIEYDHAVLAIHANQALTLLGDEATDLERKILRCFKTSRNICYLHSDTSVSLSLFSFPVLNSASNI